MRFRSGETFGVVDALAALLIRYCEVCDIKVVFAWCLRGICVVFAWC